MNDPARVTTTEDLDSPARRRILAKAGMLTAATTIGVTLGTPSAFAADRPATQSTKVVEGGLFEPVGLPRIPGFAEERYTVVGETRSIFHDGTGPIVLLMHELPGLTPRTVEFARYLISKGFQVVMPLLHGDPLDETGVLAASALLCIRREFECLGSGRSSAVTDWLRPLCRDLDGRSGGHGIGVVGMCFSGGFVLSMMLEPSVRAPVCAQPSLPYLPREGLDIAPADLVSAVDASTTRPLLFVRFRDDLISPASRQTTLEAAFAGKGRMRSCILPGNGHSTLVYDYPDALATGIDPRAIVVEHLRSLLST